MEIRVWVPDTLAGWRYCLKNPKSFIVGRYGFAKFIKQRGIMWAAKKRAQVADAKLEETRTKLIDARKEISRLKRGK